VKPKIHLALTDDWEVRGNGSGDPRVVQFAPMRQLMAIYEKHGVVGSFNTELMQQMTFRRLQDQHPELKPIADEWDEMVIQAFRRGHDIQPHVHPQWSQAEYLSDLKWRLSGDWSILKYPREEMRCMLAAAQKYLESLLRPINASYKCVSYRAGSRTIAPSPHALGVLRELGFIFDQSMCDGLYCKSKHIEVDYRQCDEGFVPYYPKMDDARRLSQQQEAIICVPTFTFIAQGYPLLSHKTRVWGGKLRQAIGHGRQNSAGNVQPQATADDPQSSSDWSQPKQPRNIKRVAGLLRHLIQGEYFIADLAQLDLPLMRAMLREIRRRAVRSGLESVPVVLENHTKDIKDFSDIDRFIAEISKAADLRCITLTQLSVGLMNGIYKVRHA
jgi:hypothetical protein